MNVQHILENIHRTHVGILRYAEKDSKKTNRKLTCTKLKCFRVVTSSGCAFNNFQSEIM